MQHTTPKTQAIKENFLNWVSSTLKTFVLQGGHYQESEKINHRIRENICE